MINSRNLSRKLKFLSNLTSKSCSLREDIFAFNIIYRPFVLIQEIFHAHLVRESRSMLSCRVSPKHYHISNNVKVTAEWNKPKILKYNAAHEVCVLDIKSTNTQSEYLNLFDFQQQRLRERTSMLRYTYIVYLAVA